MYHPFLINKPSHKLVRSKLRNHMTKAEKTLWEKLRHKQLDFWFKRQVSINKFIVDFYCPQKHDEVVDKINACLYSTSNPSPKLGEGN